MCLGNSEAPTGSPIPPSSEPLTVSFGNCRNPMTTLLSIFFLEANTGWSDPEQNHVSGLCKSFKTSRIQLVSCVEMSHEPFWNPWAQKNSKDQKGAIQKCPYQCIYRCFYFFAGFPIYFQPWTSTLWETFKSCIPSDRFRQKCQSYQSYQSRQLGQHGCTCTWNSLRQAQTGAPTGEKVLTSSFFIYFFLKSANSCFAGCSLSFHLADSSKLCFSRPLASRNPPRNGPPNKGLQNTPKQMLPKSISHDFGWITSITTNHGSIADFRSSALFFLF